MRALLSYWYSSLIGLCITWQDTRMYIKRRHRLGYLTVWLKYSDKYCSGILDQKHISWDNLKYTSEKTQDNNRVCWTIVLITNILFTWIFLQSVSDSPKEDLHEEDFSVIFQMQSRKIFGSSLAQCLSKWNSQENENTKLPM